MGATSSIGHDPPVSIMETIVSMVEPALVIASPSMGPPDAFQVMRKAAPTPATMEEPTPNIVAAAAVALTASTQIPAPEEVVDGGDGGKSASSSGCNHGKKEKVKKRPRAFMTPKEEAAFHARRKLKKFAAALENAFRLRPELRELPSAGTMVCRCEDVPYSRLRSYSSWRAAKLQTRCGMGSCQGRICGPATEFLFKWKPDSVRPPIFPARVESLAVATASGPEPEHQEISGGYQ